MQITRQTDYALRCVYYLAGRNGEVVMIEGISREMSIPRSFLAKILQKLVKAGIAESHRGVKGGFTLARSPREVSIYDVMLAIEGPVTMNICAVDKKLCERSAQCSIHPVWVRMRKEMEKMLRKENFAKLRR